MPIQKRKTKTAKSKREQTVRKSSQGKRVRKFVQATPNSSFYVHNGPILKNLKELVKALEKDMSDKQYHYHTLRGQNDFSRWIEDVLNDRECARSLRRVKQRATAIDKLKACIKRYT